MSLDDRQWYQDALDEKAQQDRGDFPDNGIMADGQQGADGTSQHQYTDFTNTDWADGNAGFGSGDFGAAGNVEFGAADTGDFANQGRYLHGAAPTLLTIIKVVEGGFAAYALIGLVRMLMNFSVALTAVLTYIKAFMVYLDFDKEMMAALDPYLNEANVVTYWVVFSVLALSALTLGLTVLDAVGVLSLRTGHNGSGLVKFVHFVTYLFMMLGIIVTFAGTALVLSTFDSGDQTTNVMVQTILIFIAVLILLVLLFAQIYHHDIVKAMRDVNEEFRTGAHNTGKKTHLSGLCTFFVICILIGVGFQILQFVEFYKAWSGVGSSLSVPRTVTGQVEYGARLAQSSFTDIVLSGAKTFGSQLVLVVKYGSIGACYRRLKR